MIMRLVWPAVEYLSSYTEALEKGWSPNNLRAEAGRDELARIRSNPSRFLAEQIDREAKGPLVVLPDGSTVPRLPGYQKWMWDAEFCGSIGFRWQMGTNELPTYCLGHIGFSVVPWKQRKGYATRALELLLPAAKQEGLAYVELTTETTNLASQRVITANGGKLVEEFRMPEAYGGAESLRFRIYFE